MEFYSKELIEICVISVAIYNGASDARYILAKHRMFGKKKYVGGGREQNGRCIIVYHDSTN